MCRWISGYMSVSNEVLKAALDAIDADMDLLRVRLKTLRHTLAPMLVPRVEESVPVEARCQGIPAQHCALQDDDARISRATFADPHAWQCAGCRHRETSVVDVVT